MRIDGLSVADGTEFSADICIVGAGITGLLLAEKLSRLDLDVLVLESGSDVADTADTLDALQYESSGSELEPTPTNRARGLGGTAHIWNTYLANRPAARYFRMEAIDFEDRPGLPYAGWPFGVDELDAYYADAEGTLMPAFSSAEQVRLATSHGLPVSPDRVIAVAEGFGFAEEFTRRLPEKVIRAPRVKVVTNAVVTEIVTDEHSTTAERVLVTGGNGKRFAATFGTLVLASGTIENARLLLVSRQRREAGIGNEHDVVGRYFMDHQRLNAGRLVPFDRGLFERSALFDLRAVGRQYWMGKLKLSESFLRERQLLNSSTLLWPRPSDSDDRGVDATKDLVRALKAGRFDAETRRYFAEVVRARDYLFGTAPTLAFVQRSLQPNIARGGWSHLPRNRERFEYFELVQQVEQAPDPENRVTLGSRRDRFGVPLPRIHARFCTVDLESARISQQLLAEELERAGVGRVVKNPTAEFPDLHQTGGIHHNLGTTRMHVDPKRGVVDADSRVHGTRNLYVTGGSVFPTGGYSNPTLTMAALSLRLAAHLANEVARRRPAAVDTVSRVA